jgi:cyclic beta-1,2-glucan synthetase
MQARLLAEACRTAERTTSEGPLLQQLARNGRLLVQAYRRIAAAAAASASISTENVGVRFTLTPDAEWLLDNFYIVEDVLREVRRDLPQGYYKKLPKLSTSALAGYPRVYALALALIAHMDSNLDEAHVTRFVQAFQTVAPLTIGELWAVPTMLRLGLLENLGRLSEHMLRIWEDRRRAEDWVTSVLSSEFRVLREGSTPHSESDAFIVRALEMLRQHGRPAALAQVEEHFKQHGLNVSDIARRENQKQAVNQVSVANCMTSLRLLSALDWNVFFEHTNLVEPMLRQDPAGAYAKQDFATRDRYRQVIEKLARGTGIEEVEIARRVVHRARGHDSPRNHVGYYLIGPGRRAFQDEVGYRPNIGERLLDAILNHPHGVYFGTIVGLMILFLGSLFFAGWTATEGMTVPVRLALLFLTGFAALLPVSDLAVSLTNYLLTLVLPPRTLPRLEFKEGIPEECATFVVVPSMLVRPDSAAALAAKLEIHYLSDPDPQLRFALLTDFADAPLEHLQEDDGYVRDALERIAELNRRYAPDGPPRFFLFHRKRMWNESEGCWMGWERKRGKLGEFNRLLLGDRNTSYTVCSGDVEELPRIRYVITLDLDTEMPHETARRLIGTLAHPLNQPRFDSQQRRVIEGYGVLQPRISFHLPASMRSRFTRIYVGSAGVDPYSAAVSDIYQDLFGAGSFTGKGIYEVDAFESATGDTFPDNHILSHDLIEGNYARCGLVTDIELYDDYPVRYHVYARRQHRWIRGDWQLLPWLGRNVPAPLSGGRKPPETTPGELTSPAQRRNPLPLLERWKIFDNLRRSLVPPALVLWLLLSWTVLPLPLGASSALAMLVLALPLLLQIGSTLFHTIKDRSLGALYDLIRNGWTTAVQVVLNGVFLFYEACLSVAAIVRTLLRLTVTRRHLLEWETHASAHHRLGVALPCFVEVMWPAQAAALVFAALLFFVRPDALAAASGFLVAWFLSPVVAWWISQDRRVRQVPLSDQERRDLGVIARKTWGFFESFVGAEDHWLPPDNFQEEPRHQVAHRTSPTNQGLLLVSTLAAHDLGYLNLGSLLERLEKTFATLEQLERHRGHFYNWYNTRTLEPLKPTYVSTVDSGNLLGCLVTLKQGLLEKATEPLLSAAVMRGLSDALQVMRESWHTLVALHDADAVRKRTELESVLKELEAAARERPGDLLAWFKWITNNKGRAKALAVGIQEYVASGCPRASELELWARRLANRFEKRETELRQLAPWIELFADPRGEQADQLLARSASDGQRWRTIRAKLTTVFSLEQFETNRKSLLDDLDTLAESADSAKQTGNWLRELREAVERSSAERMLQRCRDLATRAEKMGAAMDFRFLYKTDRHLFSIGYNVAQEKLDAACYDLMASEARLSSFLAIARGEVPTRHWFYLRRAVVRAARQSCLVSWAGTMFEYLMPQLFLRSYAGTLLHASCEAAVEEQMAYGRRRRVPWGISESAFSSHTASSDYQYQAFGVPALGLKRGLAEDLVIAPYATALATIVRPHDALRNFRYLAAEGALGKYGFYESVDYTRSRLPENHRSMVVRCFMAHHQGMSLVALANCLLGNVMVRRFHAEPMVRATELLLQERMPSVPVPVDTPDEEAVPRPAGPGGLDLLCRQLTTPNTPGPRTHLLSGGQYLVMVTNAGSGFSRCGDLDVTRWREDYTRDDHGQFCYLRDITSGILWSAAHQPVCRPAKQYEVVYSADKADFRRTDGAIATHLEITVATEHSAEVRRLTLTNHDRRPHDLEVTSYAEVVLAPHVADLSHPAFGKLFLETEWLPSHGALLCRRRPRAAGQEPIWAVHVVSVEGETSSEIEYETDRARFLGRGRTPAAPAALEPGARLSGTTGPVLDPIFSIRRRFRLEAGGVLSLLICTGVAKSREEAVALADHYRDGHAVSRVFDLAWAHSQIELRHLQITTAEAHLFQRLVTHLIYSAPTLRAEPEVLAANRQGQAALWRYGISGDNPILLVRVASAADLPLVRHLLLAHSYWHLKHFTVDLVILCEEAASYVEELCTQIQETVRSSHSNALADKPGGVFVRKASQMPEEDRILVQAAARVVLDGRHGSLSVQLAQLVDRVTPTVPVAELFTRKQRQRKSKGPSEPSAVLPADLLFANAFGGFTPDGREYCILASPRAGALPPAPWVNVVANPRCGFLVSESGLGCTWTCNSQQYRLTPWNNDPTSDPPSEVVYLRDEENGDVWTPTPRPLGLDAATLVRHGQGYTRFEQRSHGLTQEMRVFVAANDPVKMIAVRIWNPSRRPRRLTATYYAEWVLGSVRDQAPLNVRTQIDDASGALLANNPFSSDFAEQVAFVDVNVRPRTLTGDRTEFLGRNGSVEAPAALGHARLSGRVGSGLDPCAAVQATIELPPGEEREVVFFLGSAPSVAAVRDLLHRYKDPGSVRAAWDEVREGWDRMLTAVQVQTPDPSVDVLVNRWLAYQVLSCRVWGRSGLYQSSGAYGFRDQLQDVMALVYGAPEETRAHILRAASRQFAEGDVQHWWHPPAGKGVRTRISDDYLFLPFVVCHYVFVTGDATILDEQVPFLSAPPLKPDQEEDYGSPPAGESATIYEHCVRALKNGLHFGAHGLPLMGAGDWNDGMNKVGIHGKGESVWNGWFFLTCLHRFAELADARSDSDFAKSCREQAERLRVAVEEHAWDGDWYRRAYFDDGTPLGSAQNDECQIDSIAQSWAVISGVAEPQRARRAMAAIEEKLIRRDPGMILLFAPPFDKGKLQPGYIKGYVPGIRENGGQYTHASTWVVEAAARLGQGDRAKEYFDLLNPIKHTLTPEDVEHYKVEPYVVVADIYGHPPHKGRGGWTWYTGSAGWLYRVMLESILGFQLRGNRLRIEPCIPKSWPSFTLVYRHRSATYHIRVENPSGVERGVEEVHVDGQRQEGKEVVLQDDRKEHNVRVVLG